MRTFADLKHENCLLFMDIFKSIDDYIIIFNSIYNFQINHRSKIYPFNCLHTYTLTNVHVWYMCNLNGLNHRINEEEKEEKLSPKIKVYTFHTQSLY